MTVTAPDLATIEQLMQLARKHGATAVRYRGVSIVMGEAPHAQPVVGLATMPAPPEDASPIADAIRAAVVADQEATPEEQAEVNDFDQWRYFGKTA